MANRLYNKQVSPKGYMAGGRVKKMGGGMSTARKDMRSGYYKNDMGMKGGKMYKEGGKVKKSKKGAINPGDKYDDEMNQYLKKRQKEAAKIDMVSKMAKRMKKGKYGKGAYGAKQTDTESALTTFNVQKSADKMRKDDPKYAKKVGDLDLISERNLSRKEGSMAKGGRVGKKKQGYKDRKDESIAMRIRKKRTARQLKASRDDSYGKFGSKSKKSGKINR
jgi:hypothetical protein